MKTIIFVAVVILIIFLYIKYKSNKKKSLIASYGEEFGLAVLNKSIKIGMSTEMVKKALGEPGKTDGRTIRENYLKEVYYYYGQTKDTKGNPVIMYIVTIENDKVTEIREK